MLRTSRDYHRIVVSEILGYSGFMSTGSEFHRLRRPRSLVLCRAVTLGLGILALCAVRPSVAQIFTQNAGHALEGKTCLGSWQVQGGRCTVDQCYGSLKVVFDRNRGATSAASTGFSSFNNPAVAKYELQPVQGLTIDGNTYKFRAASGSTWILIAALRTGSIDPRPRLPHMAEIRNLTCN